MTDIFSSSFSKFRTCKSLTINIIVVSLYQVGPVSLVGGTAAIYSSLLHHPSSSLTQLSLVFMMLLAVQYAIQPRLSKRYIAPQVNKESVALVEEVIKTGMAAMIFLAKPKAMIQQELRGMVFCCCCCCCVSITVVRLSRRTIMHSRSYSSLFFFFFFSAHGTVP